MNIISAVKCGYLFYLLFIDKFLLTYDKCDDILFLNLRYWITSGQLRGQRNVEFNEIYYTIYSMYVYCHIFFTTILDIDALYSRHFTFQKHIFL